MNMRRKQQKQPPPAPSRPRRRRLLRGGAEEQPFPDPEPMDDGLPPQPPQRRERDPPERMDLGPELPPREKERIRRRTQQPQGPPPEPLRPGPPPRADLPPPPAPPQIPEGVEIIRREMDALIKEISEGVRRTAGDVSESDRLTEINDRLVNFVQGVMEALSRLLVHIEAYNSQMTELTKQLGAFRTQIGKSSGKTDKAAKDAVSRLADFKDMVSKSLQAMKSHLRAEDMVPLQQALNNWTQLMNLTSKAPPASKGT